MKKIDLLYADWIFAPNGVSSVIRLLYEHKHIFEANGIEVRFISNETYWTLPQSDGLKKRISPVKLLKRGVIWMMDLTSKLIPKLNSAFSLYRIHMRSSERMAKRYVLDEDPDDTTPIFMHDIFLCYFYSKFTKAKRPILLTMHSNGESFKMLYYYYPKIKGSWVDRWLNKIEHKTFNRVSDFCFVANNPRLRFLYLHPEISEVRAHYVYNGLPLYLENENEDKNHKSKNGKDYVYQLCCVASITERKGQDIIIEALEQMNPEQRNRIQVTFVGDGSTRKILEERCAIAGFQENVRFVGNQTDVEKYLRESDIFILTSRDEGFPMAILEAERAGLPVISTNVAGIPEMINNGETGFVIEPNVSDLKSILCNIYKYDWKEMGNQSRELFRKNFSVENMVRAYSEILKTL